MAFKMKYGNDGPPMMDKSFAKYTSHKTYTPQSMRKDQEEYDPANRNKKQLNPSSKGNSNYLEKRKNYEYDPNSRNKKSPNTMRSPLTIAPEGEITANMEPINLKTKDNRKKISKSEQRTAKLKHGKDSEEYKQAKDKTKKLQTGREKIRTKMQEKKDKRTRKKNINKTKKDKIKQTKAEAKFLKNNPNIPMP